MRIPKIPPRAWRILLAMIAAGLLAAGLIVIPADDPTPAPAPTATSSPSPAAATPAPAATPPPLAGTEHEHLGEPGDVDLGGHQGVVAPAGTGDDTLPGCSSRFNTHNYSSRNGTAVRDIAAHYTVSRNVPGWADVDANQAWLNTPAAAASATAIIDGEGHCAYTVPLGLKAWTEASGNSFSVGIEFVAMGDEGKLTSAAIARGGMVIAAIARLEHIPLQLGDVTGCAPVRAGIVDHAMYGACGGGHHDLRPMYGTSVPRLPSDDKIALGPLIAAARHEGITSTDRVTCRKLNWWRTHARPHGRPEKNAVRRRQALASRSVRCLASGPVLTG